MKRFFYSVAIIVILPPIALAEGLIYKLPEDGHWVRFVMDGIGTEQDGTTEVRLVGTMTLSSVGTTVIDGSKHRWIEFVEKANRAGVPYTKIDKLLIPESQLGKGKEPVKHVVEAWRKYAREDGNPRSRVDRDPVQIEDLAVLQRTFGKRLHGPFETATELEVARVDSRLGKLDCKGINASETAIRFSRAHTVHSVHSTYVIRLHDKAPFGVVTWEVDVKTTIDGTPSGAMHLKMTILDFGIDAESVVPEAREMRSWTLASGESFEGKFLQFRDNKVEIQIADNSVRKIHPSKLSEADRQWYTSRLRARRKAVRRGLRASP